MFYRWRRMEEKDRRRVWRLYGWFSGLMACGSCVGAVAWAAYMMFLENVFNANTYEDLAQQWSRAALAYSWRAAFLVMYAVEFLCLSAAKLMVLDRMTVFAAPQGTRLQTRWTAAARVVMAAVVLGNAVGLAANAAAAVRYQKAAQAMGAASTFYASNETNDGYELFSLSLQEVQLGGSILSVQLFCEVAVLLLIVAAFVVVGVLSARRVRARLLEVDAASDAAETVRAVRLQMVATTAVVFVAFVLRAAFATMFAVAFQLRVIDESCAEPCGECGNVYVHMAQWMGYTPEFQLLIVLVSSPLALLVALWGMTSKATLHLMQSSQREGISLKPMPSALQE
jgi:hypothetical protein